MTSAESLFNFLMFNPKDIQVGMVLSNRNRTSYEVMEVKEAYWGDGATGFCLLKKSKYGYDYPHFWMRPEEMANLVDYCKK